MNSCKLSPYAPQPNGYTVIKIDGRNRMHHRHVYCLANKLSYESIADKVVMHTCDTRNCINPEHLVLGTQKENMQDKVTKGRQLRGEQIRQAKLTEEDVKLIRQLHGKLTCEDLSKRFGVGPMQISRIHRRERWAHVK